MLENRAWLLHLVGVIGDIVVRLHVHKADIVIPTPEKAGSSGV